MTTILCTLYNSLYLDKGLVLYDSLCECANDFKLYVLCMDDKCYEVLTDLKQEHHIPVRLSDFETGDEALLKAKGNRSMGEYCWTCSSSFIRYVLKHYEEDSCTYIDADMYFYNDPQILVDEMLEAGKSVMITPHRFPERKMNLSKKVGLYCVEFNSFKNDKDGLEVLEYWRNRCLECCSNIGDGVHWGDQKYLEEFEVKFNCIHVCLNLGAGVAPWNISLYNLSNSINNIVYKENNKEIPLVFFHFQSIRYITRYIVDTGLLTEREIDFSLVNKLYYKYLRKIEKKKEYISNHFGLLSIIRRHPSETPLLGLKYLGHILSPRRIYSDLKLRQQHIDKYVIDINNDISND